MAQGQRKAVAGRAGGGQPRRAAAGGMHERPG